VILLLAGVGLWLGIHGPQALEFGSVTRKQRESRASLPGEVSEATGSFKTKSSNREIAGPRATHAPERLKEFMLPEIAIDGLTLGEALRKLMGVYEDACKRTGETPLRLTFDLPPGNAKKLHLKLSPRNFSTSVQLLATFSGMSVCRNKLNYRFEPFADERKQVTRALTVPPDFTPAGTGLDTEADPFAEDEPPQMPMQKKFTQQVFEIPSGMDWTPPDVSQMTEGQVQIFSPRIPIRKSSKSTIRVVEAYPKSPVGNG
jgi:hypothetical protein